jgi:hypothetical protein
MTEKTIIEEILNIRDADDVGIVSKEKRHEDAKRLAYVDDFDLIALAKKKANRVRKYMQNGDREALSEEIEDVKGTTIRAKLERATSEKYQRYQLRRFARIETAEAEMSKGRQKKEAIASEKMIKARTAQKKRNTELLKKRVVYKGEERIGTLADLAEKGKANPRNRLFSIKARIRGMIELAEEEGMSVYMLTITLPSRFHSNSKKYDGSTPKQGQEFLTKKWARVRSKLERDNVRVYGVRFPEAHKDWTPHWHVAVLVSEEQQAAVAEVIEAHYLKAEDADRDETGADVRRIKWDKIDGGTDAAVAYMLPYMIKSIGGGTGVDEAFEKSDEHKAGDKYLTIEAAATAAEAWRSAWQIPAYKVFSTGEGTALPSAETWEVFRKAKFEDVIDDDRIDAVIDLIDTAQTINFREFVKAWRLNQVFTNRETRRNSYNEEVKGKVIGVSDKRGQLLAFKNEFEIMNEATERVRAELRTVVYIKPRIALGSVGAWKKAEVLSLRVNSAGGRCDVNEKKDTTEFKLVEQKPAIEVLSLIQIENRYKEAVKEYGEWLIESAIESRREEANKDALERRYRKAEKGI